MWGVGHPRRAAWRWCWRLPADSKQSEWWGWGQPTRVWTWAGRWQMETTGIRRWYCQCRLHTWNWLRCCILSHTAVTVGWDVRVAHLGSLLELLIKSYYISYSYSKLIFIHHPPNFNSPFFPQPIPPSFLLQSRPFSPLEHIPTGTYHIIFSGLPTSLTVFFWIVTLMVSTRLWSFRALVCHSHRTDWTFRPFWTFMSD